MQHIFRIVKRLTLYLTVSALGFVVGGFAFKDGAAGSRLAEGRGLLVSHRSALSACSSFPTTG